MITQPIISERLAKFNLEHRLETFRTVTKYAIESQKRIFKTIDGHSDQDWNHLLNDGQKVLLLETGLLKIINTNSARMASFTRFHEEKIVKRLFSRDTPSNILDLLEDYFDDTRYIEKEDKELFSKYSSKRKDAFNNFHNRTKSPSRIISLRLLYLIRKFYFLNDLQSFVDLGLSEDNKVYEFLAYQMDFRYGWTGFHTPSRVEVTTKSILTKDGVTTDSSEIEKDLNEYKRKLLGIEKEFEDRFDRKGPDGWNNHDYNYFRDYQIEKEKLNHQIRSATNTIEQQKELKAEQNKLRTNFKKAGGKALKEVTKASLSTIGYQLGKKLADGDHEIDWEEVTKDILIQTAKTVLPALLNVFTGGIGGSLVSGILDGFFATPDPYLEHFQEIKDKIEEVGNKVDEVLKNLKDMDNYIRESLPEKVANEVINQTWKKKLVEELNAMDTILNQTGSICKKKDSPNEIEDLELDILKSLDTRFLSHLERLVKNAFNREAHITQREVVLPNSFFGKTHFNDLIKIFFDQEKSVTFTYRNGMFWLLSEITALVKKYLYIRQEVLETLSIYYFVRNSAFDQDLITTIQNQISPENPYELQGSLIALEKMIVYSCCNTTILQFANADTDAKHEYLFYILEDGKPKFPYKQPQLSIYEYSEYDDNYSTIISEKEVSFKVSQLPGTELLKLKLQNDTDIANQEFKSGYFKVADREDLIIKPSIQGMKSKDLVHFQQIQLEKGNLCLFSSKDKEQVFQCSLSTTDNINLYLTEFFPNEESQLYHHRIYSGEVMPIPEKMIYSEEFMHLFQDPNHFLYSSIWEKHPEHFLTSYHSPSGDHRVWALLEFQLKGFGPAHRIIRFLDANLPVGRFEWEFANKIE